MRASRAGDLDFDGAVAVVTGGATGICRATINLLEAEGARAVSWDLHGDSIVCDVTDPDAVAAAMRQTIEEFGVPTILVAGAGVTATGRLTAVEIADWDRLYAVNVRGVFLSLRAVVAEMHKAEIEGSIVLISDVTGLVSDPGQATCSSANAAVAQLARCAAVELGPSGIRVNAIAPGTTITPMMGPLLRDREYAQRVADTTPLGRIGEPEDIAEGIVNVIRSRWITGQVIAVDGGSMLLTARGADLVGG